MGIPGIINCIIQFSPDPLCPKRRTPPKGPPNDGDQACPRLYNCLFLFPQAVYRSAECIYHLIVHYIVVAERSCKDCPIPDRKESRSELTSQLLLVLELWYKFRNDVFKPVFIHIPQLVSRNFGVRTSVPPRSRLVGVGLVLVFFSVGRRRPGVSPASS